MKKTFLLTAIILALATGVARAGQSVTVRLTFEIPRFINVNWFPNEEENGGKEKEDKEKDKDKKDKKEKNISETQAAAETDGAKMSSNSDGNIIVNVEGKETELRFVAGDGNGVLEEAREIIFEKATEAAKKESNREAPQPAAHSEAVVTFFLDN